MIKNLKQIIAVSTGALALIGLVASLGIISPVQAKPEVISGDNISQTKKVDGSFFGSGSNVQVTDSVEGDVFVAGQSITITGDVRGDVLVMAQSVTITGDVSGDVRGMAQSISINGNVAGSISTLGQTMVIAKGSTIGRDVHFMGESLTVEGQVKRDAIAATGKLYINGLVGRDITYTSDKKLTKSSEASIGGEVNFTESTKTKEHNNSSNLALGLVYNLLALGLGVILLTLLAPRWIKAVRNQTDNKPLRALLIGAATIIISPVVLLILLFSVVGMPVAFVLSLLYLALLLGGIAFSAHYLGYKLLKNNQNLVIQGLVGTVVLVILLAIPLVNILTFFAASAFGMGMILQDAFNRAHDKPLAPTETKPAAKNKAK